MLQRLSEKISSMQETRKGSVDGGQTHGYESHSREIPTKKGQSSKCNSRAEPNHHRSLMELGNSMSRQSMDTLKIASTQEGSAMTKKEQPVPNEYFKQKINGFRSCDNLSEAPNYSRSQLAEHIEARN